MALKIIQDDEREIIVANHCCLKRSSKRLGPDASDLDGNLFELKSGTMPSISTGRDVGLRTISIFRKRYWIFAFGKNEEKGFRMESLYIASPKNLEIKFSKMEKQLKQDWEKCQKVLISAKKSKIDSKILSRIEKILERGIRLNNHKIPKKLIEKYATKIDHKSRSSAKRQIQEFIKNNPLD